MSLNKHEIIFAISLFLSVPFLLIIFQLYDVHLVMSSARRYDSEEGLQDDVQCLMSYNLTKTGFAELEEINGKGTLHGLPVTKYRRSYSSMCSIIIPSPETRRETQRLIYNPFEADDIIANITKQLAAKNRFSWHQTGDEYELCYEITKTCKSYNLKMNNRFIEEVTSGSKPRYIQTTKEFVDFAEYPSTLQQKLPLYINVLSHPVDLFIANYERNSEKRSNEMSLEDCLARHNGTGCIRDQDTILYVTHFCGETTACSIFRAYKEGLLPGVSHSIYHISMNNAIVNLAEGYSIIATRDKMKEFISILEKLLPQFFSGINNIYSEYIQDHPPPKPYDLSRKSRSKLEEILSDEMAVYYFVKERFSWLYDCME